MKKINVIFKILLSIVFSILTLVSFADVVTIPLVKEMTAHRKDSTFKYIFYFDEKLNKVMEDMYRLEAGQSYPVSRKEWIYENNQCVTQRTQYWRNGNWETIYLLNAKFSGNSKNKEEYISVKNNIETTEKTLDFLYENEKLKSVICYYKGTQDNLDLKEELSFNYEGNDLKSQKIKFEESIPTNNSQVIQYAYNVSGKLDSVVFFSKSDELEQKEFLSTYFYDKLSGNLICQFQKKWDGAQAKWENQTKIEYVYNQENKLINELYYYYGMLLWNPDIRYEYKYNTEGLLEEKVMYRLIYRQWRKIYTIAYGNIINGCPNLIESKYNFWGGETNSYAANLIPYYLKGTEMDFMYGDRIELKYIMVNLSSLPNYQSEKEKITLYPNPSNGVFYLDTQNHDFYNWAVYDAKGMLLKSNYNYYRTGIIDLTSLSDGMYLIKITTKDKRQLQQKIIINKGK